MGKVVTYTISFRELKGIIILFLAMLAGTILSGCSISVNEGDYKQVSTSEAISLMETEEYYIILDVRTAEEYAQGHIPNAINLPVESIDRSEIEQLPYKDQLILVYCRSGNRSREASGILSAQGYTNIVEFGGINTWPGEVVTD